MKNPTKYQSKLAKGGNEYTVKDAMKIIGEIVGRAKKNLTTNRAKIESLDLDNILVSSADGFSHTYGELISHLDKMTFIMKEMRTKYPAAEPFFEKAYDWINANKDMEIDKKAYGYYMIGCGGKMFE